MRPPTGQRTTRDSVVDYVLAVWGFLFYSWYSHGIAKHSVFHSMWHWYQKRGTWPRPYYVLAYLAFHAGVVSAATAGLLILGRPEGFLKWWPICLVAGVPGTFWGFIGGRVWFENALAHELREQQQPSEGA